MTSELTTLGDKRGRPCVRMGSDQPWVVECGGGWHDLAFMTSQMGKFNQTGCWDP